MTSSLKRYLWLRKAPVVHGGLLIWLDHAQLFRSGGRVIFWRWKSGNDQRITKVLWEEGHIKKAHNYRGKYVITVNCHPVCWYRISFLLPKSVFLFFFHFSCPLSFYGSVSVFLSISTPYYSLSLIPHSFIFVSCFYEKMSLKIKCTHHLFTFRYIIS